MPTDRIKGVTGRLTEAGKQVAEEAQRAVKRARGETEEPAEAQQEADPSQVPLERRSKSELQERAKELGIKGRTTMNKQELIEAIRSRN